jgi:hypothetical protein
MGMELSSYDCYDCGDCYCFDYEPNLSLFVGQSLVYSTPSDSLNRRVLYRPPLQLRLPVPTPVLALLELVCSASLYLTRLMWMQRMRRMQPMRSHP